jgi:hypothetical protein
VKGLVVFNIAGNHYRLVALVQFNTEKVYVRQAGDTTRSIYHTVQLCIDFFLGSGDLTHKPDVEQILEPRFLN